MKLTEDWHYTVFSKKNIKYLSTTYGFSNHFLLRQFTVIWILNGSFYLSYYFEINFLCTLFVFFESDIVRNFLSSSIRGSKPWNTRVFVYKSFEIYCAVFLFPKPGRHYAKLLICILAISGVKYFHKVAHAQTACPSKQVGFSWIAIFLILRNNKITTKVIRFSETTSKTQHCTKVPVDLVTFTEKILNGKFHFLCSAGNVVKGSCCIFELSEWEGGCTICFELKKYRRPHQPNFGKPLRSSTKESKNCNTWTAHIIITDL